MNGRSGSGNTGRRTRDILHGLNSGDAGAAWAEFVERFAPLIQQAVNQFEYEQDLAECSEYSDEVNVAGKAAGGAAAGAVVGAAVGAIWDGYRGNSPERGAATGAVVGGAGGTGSGLNERSQVVKSCLRGRGYRVLN